MDFDIRIFTALLRGIVLDFQDDGTGTEIRGDQAG